MAITEALLRLCVAMEELPVTDFELRDKHLECILHQILIDTHEMPTFPQPRTSIKIQMARINLPERIDWNDIM